ncbi:MAG: sigma-70 family RNA polymerase sigma factor [Planctomycetota bacterium]
MASPDSTPDPPAADQAQAAADLSGLTPEQLLAAYRTGRTDAFEALIRLYQTDLFRFLMRFVGAASTADDLFQETFLQVHQSAHTFDTTKRFKPWLFTIAANKARDYLRRNKRRQAAPLSATVDGPAGEGVSFVDLMEADLTLPNDAAQSREVAELVRDLVHEMPEHLREVLDLAYFQQLAYKEVAEVLGIPLGTVKSRLHAAVGTFADLWKNRYGKLGSDLEAS